MPEAHGGRLFDHIHLRVADLEASKRFYAGALASLGLELSGEGDGWFSADELFVSDDGPRTTDLLSPSRRPIARPSIASTRPRSPRAGATTADRASVRTTPVITPRTCSIPIDS